MKMKRAARAPRRAGRARAAEVVRLVGGRATLGDLCDRLARAYGDRVALTTEDSSARKNGGQAPDPQTAGALSYRDIAARVASLAGALAEAGVEPGDRVAVCMGNRVDYALMCFAAVRCGAVAVPLHHHLKPAEVESLTVRSKATHLVADPSAATTNAAFKTLTTGAEFERAVASSAPLKKAMPMEPGEPALILFTSGTTGAPKGATITSRSLLAVARLAALVPDARNESGVCGLPLAHVMGMSTLLCALLAGAPLHWVSKFEADVVLERIQERKASFFIGVPAMYAMLAEANPEKFDLSSVRLWASGADAMNPTNVERFRKLGCAFASPRGRRLLTSAFAEIYGMVELSGPAILKLTAPQPFDDGPLSSPVRATLKKLRARLPSRAKGDAKDAKDAKDEPQPPSAMGILIPPYRARIVDDDGKQVKTGVVGELVLKGPGVTSGYDNDPDATAKTTKDGWLKTGDLAWRNRVGLIAFATRKKDVVKHGGFSVFPAEVEAQLAQHPDVAEAIVFGVPHATKGAVPAAAIVLRGGATTTELELLAWARNHIASYKAPRSLAIVNADDVPRNANKKVLKDALKQSLLGSGALKSESKSQSDA